MKKLFYMAGLLSTGAVVLSGCSDAGEKSANLSLVYLATAILSIVLFVCCLFLVKNHNKWIILLFSSVAVINAGYYWLAVSPDRTQALLANGLAYLGSVFLPLSIFMIILKVTSISYKKWLPLVLGILGLIMFVIASSPLYCDIYYKWVDITHENGVTVLDKEYGSLHILYMLYLLFYFVAMIATVIWATARKKIESNIYAVILNFAVFVNIAVWLMEQFVDLDFELLSVSYIISELFLLGLFMIIQENDKKPKPAPITEEVRIAEEPKPEASLPQDEDIFIFTKGLESLTNTEKAIYNYYLDGKTTKEVLALLNITENTLKFHNKNIYGKLGVSSRKKLLEMAKFINK